MMPVFFTGEGIQASCCGVLTAGLGDFEYFRGMEAGEVYGKRGRRSLENTEEQEAFQA